ncbi:sensor histidine kinase [Vagococcus hydrophili]|uniref:histidine kinase n=1 Tax=Vagococcus hydrophili TaxID=2714947 RepID=A0A6G8AUC3_9ENTE|nr:HAMP domain-containing sensor histidine kinase [Vagococcus hydrophili]QIL48580.1 HAMP domain-containing histidine kinase [Vagococcus hydrophili]
MNKLSRKFMIGIIFILTTTALVAILINKNYVAKYYVSQKKDELRRVSEQFMTEMKETNFEIASKKLEEEEKITIVKAYKKQTNDEVNNDLRESFKKKGIGFKKLWLWGQDYEQVMVGNERINLYEQEKLNYSLLVDYRSNEEELYAIGMIVPNITDSFYIINTFFAIIISITIIISLIFIAILVRKIVKPLNQIELFAVNMGDGKYTPLKIETKDELEEVANTLNRMGEDILSYQAELTNKNQQMEDLLNNVAHDLKTPVSLIKLYSEGIKDELDDGTFLETIIEQSNNMSLMIEELLLISKIDKEKLIFTEFNLSEMVHKNLNEYQTLMKERQIKLCSHVEPDIMFTSHLVWLNSIFSNLISNGIKYTSQDKLKVTLEKIDEVIFFEISNQFDNEGLDLTQIWEPYYVGEKSRSKELSGTGLGLYHVKKMVDKLDLLIDVTVIDHEIIFKLSMRNEER